MKLYDNDSHRDTFTELVYELLSDDSTWERANQIIESFDSAPAVELPDTTLGGTYVNIEWLKRTEAELKKYKELVAHPQGGPGDDSIEIVKPAEGDPHTYLKPCRICDNTEIVYERYGHRAGERWRCWCTKCLACIDPGWAQDRLAVREIWNQSPPNDPLTLEEMLEMDGEPVWTVTLSVEGSGRWELCTCEMVTACPLHKVLRCVTAVGEVTDYELDTYGKTWLAYRRKPEEVEEL